MDELPPAIRELVSEYLPAAEMFEMVDQKIIHIDQQCLARRHRKEEGLARIRQVFKIRRILSTMCTVSWVRTILLHHIRDRLRVRFLLTCNGTTIEYRYQLSSTHEHRRNPQIRLSEYVRTSPTRLYRCLFAGYTIVPDDGC